MTWSGLYGSGTDARYREALSLPHQVYMRLDVCDRFGNVLYANLPFNGGTVQATLQNRVSRTLKTTVDSSWLPVTRAGAIDSTALLAPFGNRLRFWRGIVLGDGTIFQFPVFYGRIDTLEYNSNKTVSITAYDTAADIVEAQFESPSNSVTTNTIHAEFVRLIQDASLIGTTQTAVFGTSDQPSGLVPKLAYSDRGKALDDLSSAGNVLWYPLADGSFVQRYTPWTVPGRSPSLTWRAGSPVAPTDGALTDYKVVISRTGIANAVIYTSQRTDGSIPVSAVARDTDPTSPTYYFGNFGRKPVTITNQTVLSASQCSFAAKTALKSARARTVTWSSPTAIVPDASIELGDIATFVADGITSVQVVTGFTVPMWENAAMPLTLRAYTPTS